MFWLSLFHRTSPTTVWLSQFSTSHPVLVSLFSFIRLYKLTLVVSAVASVQCGAGEAQVADAQVSAPCSGAAAPPAATAGTEEEGSRYRHCPLRLSQGEAH